MDCGNSRTILISSLSRGWWKRSKESPRMPICTTRVISPSEIWFNAAFSLSTVMRRRFRSVSRYQSTSTTPVVPSKISFTAPASFTRLSSVGPYISATSVCSTGGPGGTSATATAAPYFAAISAMAGRTRTAISWLCRLRSPFGRRFT